MQVLFTLLTAVNRVAISIRNIAYYLKICSPQKAPLPVISIGNIVFGGSSKTPLSMALISALIEHGFKPALITRGYKGRWEKKGGILTDGKQVFGGWKDSGDEAFMVALNFPQIGIFIGKNRLASCIKTDKMGFNVAVLDDGFQHRRLHRDLDIVIYDPEDKTAFRESLSSLKRAHIILFKQEIDSLSKKKLISWFPQIEFYEYRVISRGIFSMAERKPVPMEVIKGKRVLAFSAIAKPKRFLSSLQAEDIYPYLFLKFPDHHDYPPSTLKKIASAIEKNAAETIITTEKDAVKIVHYELFQKIPSFYLRIEAKPEEAFLHKVLSSLLESYPTR